MLTRKFPGRQPKEGSVAWHKRQAIINGEEYEPPMKTSNISILKASNKENVISKRPSTASSYEYEIDSESCESDIEIDSAPNTEMPTNSSTTEPTPATETTNTSNTAKKAAALEEKENNLNAVNLAAVNKILVNRNARKRKDPLVQANVLATATKYIGQFNNDSTIQLNETIKILTHSLNNSTQLFQQGFQSSQMASQSLPEQIQQQQPNLLPLLQQQPQLVPPPQIQQQQPNLLPLPQQQPQLVPPPQIQQQQPNFLPLPQQQPQLVPPQQIQQQQPNLLPPPQEPDQVIGPMAQLTYADFLKKLLFLKNQSCSIQNYAVKLMESFFWPNELTDPEVNVSGGKLKGETGEPKRPLDPDRMNQIRDITLRRVEGTEREKMLAWRRFRKAMTKRMATLKSKKNNANVDIDE